MIDDNISMLQDRYLELLEQLLEKTRQRVEEYTADHLPPAGDGEDNVGSDRYAVFLEDYLYAVNSFYYRSFHEQLFPAYRADVNRETARIFKVSRQEETVREDIANNLIRYAQLFNRLKDFNRVLEDLVQEVGTRLAGLENGRMQVHHDVCQALRELRSQVTGLADWFGYLEKVLATPSWWETARKDRDLEELLVRWGEEEPGTWDARVRDAVSRWLASMAWSIDSLQVVIAEASHLSPHVIQDRVRKAVTGTMVTPPSLPASWAGFVQLGLGPRVQAQAERVQLLLELETLQHTVPERSVQALGCLKDYLSGILSLLTRIMELESVVPCREMIKDARQLGKLNLAEVEAVGRLLREFARELGACMDRLEHGQNLSPAELERLVGEPLDRYERELRKRVAARAYYSLGGLGTSLRETLSGLALFWVKFTYFRDRLDASLQELDRYRELYDLLRGYKEAFANLQDDTGLLLSPRTLHRCWKDITVEVERYPLQRGRKFPEGCCHLLEQGGIERRLVPEERHLTVLEERGDIFRVEVDGLARWEIPYVVVGMRE